jgi:hypothetical protein
VELKLSGHGSMKSSGFGLRGGFFGDWSECQLHVNV